MLDLTPILDAGMKLIAVILTIIVIPYLQKKTTAQQQEEINKWTKVAVTAAEQIFAGSGRGEEKKNYVIAKLAEKGIKLDTSVLDTYIEAAVYELKNGIITTKSENIGAE